MQIYQKMAWKNSSTGARAAIRYYFPLELLFSIEALMKSLKRGWGWIGLDLNSGWN